MIHGTRATYQAGCSCLPCKAANASYIAHLRRLKAHGKTPLGATTSGREARKLVQALLIERFTKGQIAKLLGLKRPILELHTEDRVKLRTELKLRVIHRKYMTGEGPSQPHV